MSLMTTAGRRGRVWSCVVCPYRGERHTVMKHVYSKHLTIEEWPYQCTLCQYSHFNYTNFISHIKWYEIHRSMASSVATYTLQGPEEIRPESKVVFSMMRQWSIEESRRYWESKRRPMVLPLPQLPCSSAQISYPTIAPHTSLPLPSVPSAPVTVVTSSTAPPSAVPVSSPAVPPPSVSTITLPSLNTEEASILDEFLIMEDTSEFDLENIPPKTTRDIGVNTSPWKDDVAELKAIIERQARALRNNTLATNRLEDLLRKSQTQQEMRSLHHGPGEGERPDVSYRKKSPPPSRLKSIVYQMPRRQSARKPEPYRRPSPLDNLFKPEKNSKHHGH